MGFDIQQVLIFSGADPGRAAWLVVDSTENRTGEARMRATLFAWAVTIALLTLGADVARAHDIWLFPQTFTLPEGGTLIVRQLAGTELDTKLDLPFLRLMTPRFELIHQRGRVDLVRELPDLRTQPELKPILTRTLDIAGLTLVAMEQDFIYHEIPNEEFLEYLTHEAYDIEQFRDRLERRSIQRERYQRSLKSLVQVGELPEGEVFKQPLGQRIEILLLQNPYLLDPGDELEVKVLFEDEPLRDRLVMAFNRAGTGPVAKATARTDAGGIARFTLDRGASG